MMYSEIEDVEEVELPSFEKALEHLINRYSKENESNTPDYILAEYLMGCLAAWNISVSARERWYGRDEEDVCTKEM